jgi:hypothetical protein
VVRVRGINLPSAGLAWLVAAVALAVPGAAAAHLSTRNITPFPKSKLVIGARWTSSRYAPPSNEWGDIMPTIWADDDDQYTIIDDGGAEVPLSGGLWRQSIARISGRPPNLHFSHVGDPADPPPHTLAQIRNNPKVWKGPLGPYYSSGLLEANHVFYATQENDWDWNANGQFQGLAGIAYSIDRGAHWTSPAKQFPAPIGNLSWVVRGRGGAFLDGYAYAIGTEREFNADSLILGRAKPDVADLTDPALWQWVTGWTPYNWAWWPVFSTHFATPTPILSWPGHITYPQISYDAPIHRYLLTFTFSYASKPPAIWRNGADLVMLEGPHPWGPFQFVAHEPEFGPSNGYAAGFPIKWISLNGRDLWMKWAANFDGCAANLDCSGGYGFNYRRLHLTLQGDR